MCNTNEHDFAVLSVSDVWVKRETHSGDIWYKPATLYCKKCGFVMHTEVLNHHNSANPVDNAPRLVLGPDSITLYPQKE